MDKSASLILCEPAQNIICGSKDIIDSVILGEVEENKEQQYRGESKIQPGSRFRAALAGANANGKQNQKEV